MDERFYTEVTYLNGDVKESGYFNTYIEAEEHLDKEAVHPEFKYGSVCGKKVAVTE